MTRPIIDLQYIDSIIKNKVNGYYQYCDVPGKWGLQVHHPAAGFWIVPELHPLAAVAIGKEHGQFLIKSAHHS